MCGPARGPAASASSATRRLLELGSGELQRVEAIVADSLAVWRIPRLCTTALRTLQRGGQVACDLQAAVLYSLLQQSVEVNAIHYNTVLQTCRRNGSWQMAVSLLQQMTWTTIQPDKISFNELLGAFAAAVSWQRALAALLATSKCGAVGFNSVARACQRSGQWQLALCVFALLSTTRTSPDVVSYGLMMDAQSAGGHWELAVDTLQRMQDVAVAPDLLCCTSAIKACAQQSQWEAAVDVLVDMRREQVLPDLFSYTAALRACPWRAWPFAVDLIRRLSQRFTPDVIAFNAALVAVSGSWRASCQLLRQMCTQSVRRDIITGSMLITAFSSGSMWPLSFQVLLWSRRQSSSALGALPAEHWRVTLQQQQLVPRDVATYSILMKSFSKAEEWPLSLYVFDTMEATSVQPDAISWQNKRDILQKTQPWADVLRVARECSEMAQAEGVFPAIGTMAKQLVEDPVAIHSGLVHALGALEQTTPQDVSSFWWSCAMLGAAAAHPGALIASSLRELPRMSSEGLLATAWGASGSAFGSAGLLLQIQEEATHRLQLGLPMPTPDVLGIIAACKFAGCVRAGFLQAVERQLRGCVEEVGGTSLSSVKDSRGMHSRGPCVVMEMTDRAVLFKPPGWEVYDGNLQKRQLRVFAQETWEASILRDPSCNYGFLHRLDVPNSGLLLVAKSHRAYCDLQVQLSAGQLVRDYLVLSRGRAPCSWRAITASVRRSAWDVRSRCGGRGRPSATQLWRLGSATAQIGATSLLKLRIVTGRQHQIRCHLAHVGLPTVCDALYTSLSTFEADLSFSPRNWLHRYRLTFLNSGGRECKVILPIPHDLKMSLDALPQLREACRLFVESAAEGV